MVVSYARNRRNYNTYTFSGENLIYNFRGISVGFGLDCAVFYVPANTV